MSTCIICTGSLNPGGYGATRMTVAYRYQMVIMAHRLAFERAWGIAIPDGMVVRHTCDTPSCINPLHLQLGTRRDNTADMVARGRHWNQAKTHCANGHEFTEDNTYRWAPEYRRVCKTCRRIRRGSATT